jgi:FMN-dependent NADH-azoreductase
MTHILHLDSSPRSDRSISRTLTREFLSAWKQIYPSDTVTYRDIGRYPLPTIDESWIAASFSPPDQITPELATALNISDELIDELLAAELYVLAFPCTTTAYPLTSRPISTRSYE